METDYRTVIIIGNGFDLNLGLPTSYLNFIDNSDDFNNKLSYPLFEYLKKQRQIKKWIDLEIELKKYANNKLYNSLDRNYNYSQFKDLCTILKLYLQELDCNIIKQGSFAVNFLRKVFDYNSIILNFNYTDTVKAVLREKYIEKNEIKMHGSCYKDIILGVEDDADIPKEFIFLKKSTSPIYQNPKYRNVIDYNQILSNADSICFFGYSLGETDHSYFNKFFQDASSITSHNRRNIYFYYYKENGKLDIDTELDTLTSYNLGRFKLNNNVTSIDVDKL